MHYPFAAIVGQEDMKLALILNGINPRIGGVLISGVKGSGKSSVSRGLADLLPPIRANTSCAFSCAEGARCENCGEVRIEEIPTPFVSLPLGATEDRVLGTIDLEKAIRDGEKSFDPGLLARVNGGLLYVDEVNLLPDHLVDILLDAAVSGVNLVEREGISVSHPARFILIGTMNPEEGELRPQLLDRFGLSVGVNNLADPAERSEVVARAMGFETSPEKFIESWADDQKALRARIDRARKILPEVVIQDTFASEISEFCCYEHVEGMRADIVIRKSAMTHAAWEGRAEVTQSDVERVKEFALAHRRNNPPEPSPPPPRPKERPENSNPPPESPNPPPENSNPPGEDNLSQLEARPEGAVSIFQTVARDDTRRYTPGGRAGRARTGSRQGPYVRAGVPQGKASNLALDATIRAASIRGEKNGARLTIRPEDFRVKIHKPPHRRLFLFVLDASRSMGAHHRMAVTKGTLLGLLDEAYQKRDEVGLIVMQGEGASLVLPPTRSVRRVQGRVRELPVGGRTPLAHGLRLARETLAQSKRRQPDVSSSVILVSDGHPTLGIDGTPPVQSAERELQLFSQTKADLLLVDTEEGQVHLGMMPEWGRRWNFPCTALDELRPGSVRRLLDAA